MNQNRPELLKRCKDLNLKNYSHSKRSELKNLLEIVEKNRENLPEKYDGKIAKVKKPRCVMIFTEGNEGKVYFSMSEAAKSLGIYPMQIYVLIATGRGMFLDRGN